MTLTDLQALATYHRAESERFANAIRTLDGGGSIYAHSEMLMHLRNRENFHQQAATQLDELGAAFTTFGNLTSTQK